MTLERFPLNRPSNKVAVTLLVLLSVTNASSGFSLIGNTRLWTDSLRPLKENSSTELANESGTGSAEVGPNFTSSTPLTAKVSDTVKDLTEDERSVVNLFRLRGPSVACVSSYSTPTSTQSRRNKSTDKNEGKGPPSGSSSLGSGSAFSISSDGYLITNYHVVQRAFQIQEAQRKYQELIANVASSQPLFNLFNMKNQTASSRFPSTAKVYLKLSSGKELLPARIVGTKPELDIAILHLDESPDRCPPALPYGKSSNLLVGQSVLAIGNPFGLDQTLTSGVVSALDRTVKGVAGNDISGCVQTDAAINPGNSGGPLLDSTGSVIGVNTMIVSTSGSNAGIGFAIPIDSIRRYVGETLDADRMARGKKKGGWLGLEVVEDSSLAGALRKKAKGSTEGVGAFVMKVKNGSPAEKAGILPLISKGTIQVGDRIVAIGGKMIEGPMELVQDIRGRVEGEQITLTVENKLGERRVLYITLEQIPKA